MYTSSVKLTFQIPHANSLKDKRMVCRSILDKSRRKFNASISEVDSQDNHQILVLGIAVVSGDASFGRSHLEKIIRFMEENTDAILIEAEEE